MRIRRMLRWTAVFTLLLPVAAWVGVNVFLDVGLPVLLNLRPERLEVRYARAWTLVPARVQVRDLRIRARGTRGAWTLDVDRASGRVDLAALRSRRFVADEVHGDGVAFRYTRTPAEEAPPGPWHVELDGVVIDGLREVRVDDWVVTGRAHASGGLSVIPGRRIELRETAVEIADAAVHLDDAPVADTIRGRLDLAIAGVDPASAGALLAAVDARAGLQGAVSDLGFLDYFLAEAPWLDIRGGAGEIQATLEVARGTFQPGSTLRAEARGLAARFLSYAVTGDGTVRFDVTAGGEAPRDTLLVDFSDYRIVRDGDRSPHVEGRGFQVRARTSGLALDGPHAPLEVVLELPDSRIRDVGVYNSYLPGDLGFELREGTGRVRGRLEASTADDVASGDLTLTGDRVEAQFDELSITGDLVLHAHLVEGRLDEGRYDMSGSRLELRNVGVVDTSGARRPVAGSRDWWADIALPVGHVHVGAKVFLDASLDVGFRDSVPFVSLFSQRTRVPGWVRSFLAVEDLTGSAHILLGDDTLDLPSFAIRGGIYELQLRLRRRQDLYRGNLFARYGALSIGMDLLGDSTRVQLLRAREWFDSQPTVP